MLKLRLSVGKKLLVMNVIFLVPIFGVFLGYLLPHFERGIVNQKEHLTEYTVQLALQAIASWEAKVQSGEMTEAEAKQMAQKSIAGFRYNGTEYFWIHDLQNKMVMHPIKPELNGKDLSAFKDANGKLFFGEMTRLATASGGGHVSYFWPKPGSEQPVGKVSYVGLFKPWGWVVGNGLYVDDVQKEVAELRKSILLVLSLVAMVILGFCALIARSLSGKLTETTGLVGKLTEDVAQIGASVAQTSQDISRAAVDQASSLQQTAAAVQELTSMVVRNNDVVKAVANSAKDSKDAGEHGQTILKEMLSSIAQISSSSAGMAETLRIIDMIGTKTKVINEIVFKTELLSFNASIEAARAGENGRGFAVVAEEVGNLSNHVGAAAHEITRLIDESRKKVDGMIRLTNESIEHGVRVTQECDRVFEALVEKVNSVSVMASDMSVANSEQTKGIEQINQAIVQLETSTQANSQSSQDASTAAQGLSMRTVELDGHVRSLQDYVKGRTAA